MSRSPAAAATRSQQPADTREVLQPAASNQKPEASSQQPEAVAAAATRLRFQTSACELVLSWSGPGWLAPMLWPPSLTFTERTHASWGASKRECLSTHYNTGILKQHRVRRCFSSGNVPMTQLVQAEEFQLSGFHWWTLQNGQHGGQRTQKHCLKMRSMAH